MINARIRKLMTPFPSTLHDKVPLTTSQQGSSFKPCAITPTRHQCITQPRLKGILEALVKAKALRGWKAAAPGPPGATAGGERTQPVNESAARVETIAPAGLGRGPAGAPFFPPAAFTVLFGVRGLYLRGVHGGKSPL